MTRVSFSARARRGGVVACVASALTFATTYARAIDLALEDEPLAPPRAAPPPSAQSPEPPPKPMRWYGWQTLAADGTAIALGALTQRWEPFAVVYLGAAPIVHWEHEQVGRGFGSFTLRLGAPLVLGVLGFGTGFVACGARDCAGTGALVGAGAGYVLAVVIDAASLAYDEAPIAREKHAAHPSIRLTPSVSLGPSGATAGLFAVF
jgi:hypothetical protein